MMGSGGDGKKHGEEFADITTTATTTGSWAEDKWQTQGLDLRGEDGRVHEKFVGDMLNGQMHGNGRYQYADGSHYDGQWPVTCVEILRRPLTASARWRSRRLRCGQRHAIVEIFRLRDGKVRATHWLIPHRQHNKMHGSGTFTFANGNEYVGEFVEDAKEGRGSLQYIDGERYDGEWYGDKQHGQGTLTYASGDRYVGQWKDGNKDGEGTLQYANGDRYEGMWRKDAAHGRGTLQYTTGDVYEGDWKDNLRHGSAPSRPRMGRSPRASSPTVKTRPRDADAALGRLDLGNWDRGHVLEGEFSHAPDSAWGIPGGPGLFCSSRVAATACGCLPM